MSRTFFTFLQLFSSMRQKFINKPVMLPIEHIMLDLDAEEYLHILGWNIKSQFIAMQEDLTHYLQYMGQFWAPLFKRLTENSPSAVLDCGGTDLVGVSEEDREKIKSSMERLGFNHIAAILPFENLDETCKYLAGRGLSDKWNEYLIQNPSYVQVAQKVFYTHGGPLEIVADEIIAWVRQ